MSIFDLERDVEVVKHKSEKGLAISKGLVQSRSNGSSNNRLFTLQQSLVPARLSSAYETQTARSSMPKKLYLIAGGGDWKKLGARTKESLASLQKA